MTKVLSAKDAAKREMILNGNMWKVILTLGTPLAIYQALNLFFKLYDSMLASTISPMSVSVVAYLSQLSLMITALGGGVAVGSSIKISEAYGAGDYTMVHKRVQILFAFCSIISTVILIMVPFSSTILKATGTPEEFIHEGTVYFALYLLDNVLVLFNTAYVAIERARGNSSRILLFNVGSIGVKITFNTLFILVMKQGIEMMAFATILSDLVIFSGFLYHLCWKGKGDVFSFSFKEVKFESKAAVPMVQTSVPVVVEKSAFQLGKVLVNGMCNIYGEFAVGALGVSNNISSMTMGPQNGFQEAGISVISQNIGAGNKRRSLKAFFTLVTFNTMASATGWYLTMKYLTYISAWFDGGDPEFAQLIYDTYYYESAALMPLGLLCGTMALLYGYGYTKLTLLINFSRVFILRVPVMWYLQNFTNVGIASIGIVMMVSNVGTGLLAVVVGAFVVSRIRRDIAREEAEAAQSGTSGTEEAKEEKAEEEKAEEESSVSETANTGATEEKDS